MNAPARVNRSTQVTARLVRAPLALYPRPWRERYGDEVADLIGDLVAAGDTTSLRAGLDLVAGASVERWRAVTRSRPVALTFAVTIVTVTALAVATIHTPRKGEAMPPYWATHRIGIPTAIVIGLWLLLEFVEFLRVNEWKAQRPATPRIEKATYWILCVAVIVTINVWFSLAPRIVPEAAIHPEIVAWSIGFAVFLVGLVVRVWSFVSLGKYFSYRIRVSDDQTVVTAGAYRVIRHPSYFGGLMIYSGIGLMFTNWIAFGVATLLPLFVTVWCIHMEERALMATLGEHYRTYAEGHKRLVPMVW